MTSKQEIVKINVPEGSVDLKLPSGKSVTHYLNDISRRYMKGLRIGEANVSYSDEVDDVGIPLISFIKNTLFNSSLSLLQSIKYSSDDL